MTDTLDLSKFREKIDAIDDKLIALIKERTAITNEVGKAKNAITPGKCPLRAGREATMIRRVVDTFTGSLFSPDAAAQIWRLFIGASLSVESDMVLSIADGGKERNEYWLAREYFGRFIPMRKHSNINQVIGDVMTEQASVGIVPELKQGEHWWLSLLDHATPPVIFAILPFVLPKTIKDLPQAMAIAHIPLEETGDDTTLIALEMRNEVSQSRVQDEIKKVNLKATLIDTAAKGDERRYHLLAVEGFHTEEEKSFAALENAFGRQLIKLHLLGAYANTVYVEDGAAGD